LLWDLCHRLSTSGPITTALGLDTSECDPLMLHIVLFRVILNFVIAHEWAHHVRGHVSRLSKPGIWVDEVRLGSGGGSIHVQRVEGHAVGYDAYCGSPHLIASRDGRQHAVELLNLAIVPTAKQDEILFSCFLCAFAGFVFLLPTPLLDAATLSRLTHPPQA